MTTLNRRHVGTWQYASHHQGPCRYVRRCVVHDVRLPDDAAASAHARSVARSDNNAGTCKVAMLCEVGDVRRMP